MLDTFDCTTCHGTGRVPKSTNELFETLEELFPLQSFSLVRNAGYSEWWIEVYDSGHPQYFDHAETPYAALVNAIKKIDKDREND